MNSFMLYRSADANTRADRAQGGHRRVSATNVEDAWYLQASERIGQPRSRYEPLTRKMPLANITSPEVEEAPLFHPQTFAF